MIYKLTLIFLSLFALSQSDSAAQSADYLLRSPNGQLKVELRINDSITYALDLKGEQLILPSAIALTLQSGTLGVLPKVKQIKRISGHSELKPLYGKSAKLSNDYNELSITFSDQYAVVFRAYNEGIAYRFVTAIKDSITVHNEKANFNFNGSPEVVYPETEVLTAWELSYVKYNSIAAIPEGKKAITPSLFSYPKTGMKVVIAESDLLDYPGMYLLKENGRIMGTWAKYPAKSELGSWGNFVSVVKERKNFIARTNGTRAFPWRIVIATNQDKDLLNNQLVYKLASPSRIGSPAWIKPGRAAWEWWHDALLPGSDIPSGMDNRNTALYKYYIDFAASNHLEYLMLDAGWSDNYDLLKVKPRVDVKELIRYGKTKNVGVFLWCVGTTLLKDLDKNLDFLKAIGAAGIKVDFFDRDDQLAIQWFEKIAKAAAKRKLMVNFHGCSKPTGLQRTYPNIVNYEAVRGAECSKWDYSANPDQHLLYPFIRMIAGPMDYTPGSMRNRTRAAFKPVDPGLPATQGTRCHELSMFVVFDQPLAMLCDSPTEYEKYPDILKFLATVPTVFEETKVLDAKLGEYALMAKKKQGQWFVGAMTNWQSRTLKLDFSFLEDGRTYTADVYTDAADANENAENYVHQTIKVTRKTKLDLPLANGGGAVAYLRAE
ncbi:MAG: glycoside hydrolase family 97 protein [Bacteroidota bacterium]